MKKENKPRAITDRHLDIPSEANRDKHINFVAQERGETDPAAEPKEDKLIKRAGKKKRRSK